METPRPTQPDLDGRIAERLRAMRTGRGWSLDELAGRAGVSRATLSRLENAEVSPTAAVLGRLCAAYSITLSRLMHMVEGEFEPHLSRTVQPVWSDPAVEFERRSVSPPAVTLAGEVVECRIGPAQRIAYDRSPRPGLEHHLVLVFGRLRVIVDDRAYDLAAGDSLRYRLQGASMFETPGDTAARYFLFMV